MHRYLLITIFAVAAWAQTTHILSPEEIQQLEIKVAQNPSDLKSQALLGKAYAFLILGATSVNEIGIIDGFDAALSQSAPAQHARDQLKTSHLAGVVGEGGQTLWTRSVELQGYQARERIRDSSSLLSIRTLGVECIDRAIVLDPHNGTWRKYRIPELAQRANLKNVLPLTPAEAYPQVKQDFAELKGRDRTFTLRYVAKLALAASAFDDAQSLGEELLKSATEPDGVWDFGGAIFNGNTTLGLVAMQRGNLDSARSYLLASGKTPGSPSLGSFGPNMSLAKALLDRGERQSVLEFFDLCAKFWKNNRGKLAQWTDQVRSGSMPDFGPNLVY